ncbi:MAG: hypothetical protein KJZ87_04880 [Thermoguttaceae bacterium]|nr:hypothetical protein [Thermoguttaceae bacterium]
MPRRSRGPRCGVCVGRGGGAEIGIFKRPADPYGTPRPAPNEEQARQLQDALADLKSDQETEQLAGLK